MSEGYSLEELEALAKLESALEARVCATAAELGRSLEDGAGLRAGLLQGFREAHADWQAAKAVAELAAHRSPDWQLRERAAAELQSEHLRGQHHRWMAQIQNAEHSGDRVGELVRVLAHIVADLAMLVDHGAPGEDEVNARFAKMAAERDKAA